MTLSWTYDAPAGVYKNHALSSDIRMAAIAQTKFVQFTTPEMGYGKRKGENVTITRIANIDRAESDELYELERIPEDHVSMSVQTIAAVEHGRAIPYTNLLTELNHFDIESAIQKKLRDDLSLSLDSQAAAAFKAGQIKAIPTGTSELTFDTDGTPSFTATSNLNVYHVEQIRDAMFTTYNINPYDGGDFVGLVSTKAKRGIMRDPNWEKWHTYTDAQAKFNGEIGRLEGIRFVEINNMAALSNSLGTNGVLGEAVFFGADAVAMANVLDPELRAKETEDYGRLKGVAWYGIYGFGQIWGDSANMGEARVIHVTSA